MVPSTVSITASKLRENVYAILDEVLATGRPVTIRRKGRTLRIVAETPQSRLSQLIRRPEVVIGDDADLVHMDWSQEWRG